MGVGSGKVIAQVGSLPAPDFPESHIMEWSEQEGWRSYKVGLTARRMWHLEEPQPQLVIMGAGGYVAIVSDSAVTEEMVDETDDGPRYRGNIRDMRLIGDHLYAVGMNRQVYRRDRPGQWVHCDQGVVQPRGNLTVSGFSAIDGLTERDIYTAGFNGEIWHYDGLEWRALDSPTNVLLHRIRVVAPDLAFAAGQEGVLLQGHGDVWRFIDHDLTSENLWGMEWFRDRLYIAGDTALFRLDDGVLSRVETGLGETFTYRHLHAFQGAMWSFGPKHIAKTDGDAWTDLTPR